MPSSSQSSTNVREVVAAQIAASPEMAGLSREEREMVTSALEGAATTVVGMLSRVMALCDSSTTGMVSVRALKDAIAGGSDG